MTNSAVDLNLLGSKLLRAVRNGVSRLDSHIEDSNLFEQHVDRGSFREQIIEEFLRPFLPKCYGIASGEVFSSDGQNSKQIDLVLHDPIFSTTLFQENGQNCLFPAESVYGLIEVKSELNSSELRTSVENIASIKRLPREASHMLDILPNIRIETGPGLSFDKRKRNPYLGVMFGYHGMAANRIASTLDQCLEPKGPTPRAFAPDYIFVRKPGYLIMNGKQGQYLPFGEEEWDQLLLHETEQDVMPLFFLIINACLGMIRLKAQQLNSYWAAVMLGGLVKSGPIDPAP